MNLDAILCDAATVREGLLHVLGGCITRVSRPSFPSELGVNLALVVTFDVAETEARHKVSASLHKDGEEMGRGEVEFSITPHSLDEGLPIATAPIVMPFAELLLSAPGLYSIDISLDDVPKRTLHFMASVAATSMRPSG